MKIICIGRNYRDHIKELHSNTPQDPVIFFKPDTAIIPKRFPFFIPEFSNNIHYEVEILVKINRVGKYIAEKFAHKYYDEISLGIDFTARDIQEQLKEKGLPWEKAKAFDGSAFIGEWLNKAKFKNLKDIDFRLSRNEQIVQKGNTSSMIWHIDALISYISKYTTLKIGDIIFTGTPAGVGQVFQGDVLKGFIQDQEMFSIHVK